MPSSTIHPLLRFTLLAVGIYLLWFFGYEHYLAPEGKLDATLSQNIAGASATLLRLFGFQASTASNQPNLILLDGYPSVSVWPACNGMVLYALFGGFILAFPGASRHKLWFIPAGIAVIYGINVLRIAILCINHLYSHQTVDFNHHYTFTFVVYGCIFLLWMWWATRLANRPSLKMPSPSVPSYK
ncbi:exosortase X [Hymenobacter crusticola]|uniref:Exosortase family protein XrtF n=1 Tax=Hymenobacter crusticola TaxID=1770526 RepID=A0A243W8B0_9BACT|nr:exosortase family protein XrtF [Hymenobacter crusticola]OUJ71215.1 exosortase family protein XrtF [Hymenobacter crusticola]